MYPKNLNAQLGFECGTEETEFQAPLIGGNPCFDVEGVNEVYIKVNVHFFLDKNCEGNLAAAPNVPENLDPKNAWNLARNYIESANNFWKAISNNTQNLNHQWNSEYHNADPSPAHPIPIRYVLEDVLIHCDEAAQQVTTFNANSKIINYRVNFENVLNVFIFDILPSPSSNPNGFYSDFFRYIGVEHFGASMFNHEIGHFMSCPHTHDFSTGTFCNDTWRYEWSWYPGNGLPNELNRNRCWSHNNVYNNIDACVEGNFNEVHPCCAWSAQNNNLMTYSAWAPNPDFSAFTQCQLNKSLTHLATTDKCNYVQSVNPACAPASAIASPVINNENCSSCIDLRASMNGNAYKLDFYRLPDMQLVTTGWIQGVPNQYCWSTKYKKPGYPYWLNGLYPNSQYQMVVHVRNACDEVDTYVRNVVTPDDCQEEDIFDDGITVNISPNPFTDLLDVNYTLSTTSSVELFVIHPSSGVYANGYVNAGTQLSGTYSVPFQSSSWNPGHQYLVAVANGIASSYLLIKN